MRNENASNNGNGGNGSNGSNSKVTFAISEFADKVIASLEKGEIPWRKGIIGYTGMPRNAKSRRKYHGWNILSLLLTQIAKGYSSSEWVTYKNAEELGGHVRKGEKATTVINWSPVYKKDEDGNETKEVAYMRSSVWSVFNLDQIDGLPEAEKNHEEACEDAEDIIAGTGAKIVHGNYPCGSYLPSLDEIHLPSRERFENNGYYYGTAFHELAHWTGHETRLNRKQTKAREEYAYEELVAELAAWMLGLVTGTPSDLEDNHAAYIQSWAKSLKKDKEIIVRACSDAEKAMNCILGK